MQKQVNHEKKLYNLTVLSGQKTDWKFWQAISFVFLKEYGLRVAKCFLISSTINELILENVPKQFS